MQKRRRYYFLIVLLCLCSPLLSQQTITVTPEKNSIILGEPVLLTIRIAGEQPYDAAIPDSLGHFEILETKPVHSRGSNGNIISTREVLVTCFDSGQFRIPPIAVEGNAGVISAGFDIMVNPLPADSTKAYGDIKQIVNLDAPEQLPYQVALAALTLLSGYMIWRLNRKHQFIPVYEATADELVPAHSLLQQLKQLKQRWIQQQTGPVVMGNELMEIFRKYLLGHGIQSRSKTGEEMIVATKAKFDMDTWQGIAQTVRLCNAMRFGKFDASVPEGTRGIEAFEKAIQPPSISFTGGNKVD